MHRLLMGTQSKKHGAGGFVIVQALQTVLKQASKKVVHPSTWPRSAIKKSSEHKLQEAATGTMQQIFL